MDKFMTVVSYGIPFHVKLINKGEKYGLDHCLTHDKTDPLVEFYDARYVKNFESLGQFVSRYYLSTLINDKDNLICYGLNLHGGIPDWKINSECMQQIYNWLEWVTKIKVEG